MNNKQLIMIVANIQRQLPSQFDPTYKNPCWTNETNEQRQCLPYFYIAGMPKCGTTDLFNRLCRHPDILAPRKKEPYFWTRGSHFLPDGVTLKEYLRNFSEAAQGMQPHQITGEASVQTFWENRDGVFIPQLLHAIQPTARIIVILRDPVERVHSEYRYMYPHQDSAVIDALISQELKYVQSLPALEHAVLFAPSPILKGCYRFYITEWQKVFPPEQLLVLHFEHYVLKPKEVLQTVFEFLSVTPPTREAEWDAILKGTPRNQSPNQCTMGLEITNKLRSFYLGDNDW